MFEFALGAEEVEEFAEGLVAQFLQVPDEMRGLLEDGGGLGIFFHLFEIPLVDGDFQPAVDESFIDLEMKLKPINLFSVAKRLMGASLRRGQVMTSGGNCKRVSVPLKDFFRGAKIPDERIPFPFVGRLDIVPPDFLHAILRHGGSERFRDQLGPETDPQDRDVTLDRLLNHDRFVIEMGMSVPFIDIHRSAEDDEAVVPLESRLRVRVASEIDVTDPEARFFEEGIEGAQRFVGHVLANEDFAQEWPKYNALSQDLQQTGCRDGLDVDSRGERRREAVARLFRFLQVLTGRDS